ncbi:MAG: hypothetical protein IJT21_05610 [Synergistaceae bacterium]|nr:hypothetical protein [Synergistaceae bacterium]
MTHFAHEKFFHADSHKNFADPFTHKREKITISASCIKLLRKYKFYSVRQ